MNEYMIKQQNKMIIVEFRHTGIHYTSLTTFFVCLKGVMVKWGRDNY